LDQRFFIRFFVSTKTLFKEIHNVLVEVWWEPKLYYPQIATWQGNFKAGKGSFEIEPLKFTEILSIKYLKIHDLIFKYRRIIIQHNVEKLRIINIENIK